MERCSVLARMSSHYAPQHRKNPSTSPRRRLRHRTSYFSSSIRRPSPVPKVSCFSRENKSNRLPAIQSWLKSICDLLEETVDKHFSRYPLPESLGPDRLLVGIFAPVEELPPTSCPVVKGTIPDCLRGGAYIRNGPNPRNARGSHHLFDGDGMLHSILFDADGSQAVLCGRNSRTTKPLISKVFGLRGVEGMARFIISIMRIISGQMDHIEGLGPANTSVSFFWDKIFVLGEIDRPFTIYLSPESGELRPERNEIGRRLPFGMSVHYQHDRCSGELFILSYFVVPPFLTIHCYDKSRKEKRRVPIWSVLRPYVFHDFGMTKNYVVIPEIKLVVDPLGMVIGDGSFMTFDKKKSARVGVVHRNARSGSEMRWFDVPGFYPLHTCNAWEENDGGTIVLVGSCFHNMEHLSERMELIHGFLEMVRIDLKTMTVVRTILSALGSLLTVVNPLYKGEKTRYVYSSMSSHPPKISGGAKLDLELAKKRVDCVIATREFGPGIFGAEPLFVPRTEAEDLDEDDGFLLMFIHDESKDKSKFIVMETKSCNLEIVSEVELPRRVPFGLHGVFVNKGELACQHSVGIVV